MSKLEDDQTIALCRFGGPIVLFVFTPAIAYIVAQLILKETHAGHPPALRNIIEMIAIVLIFLISGIWLCKKGYGWFEWLSFSKKNKM